MDLSWLSVWIIYKEDTAHSMSKGLEFRLSGDNLAYLPHNIRKHISRLWNTCDMDILRTKREEQKGEEVGGSAE